MRHAEQVQREFGEESDIVYKKMLFSEQVAYNKNRPCLFNLIEHQINQATGQWHLNLNDPKVQPEEHYEVLTSIHFEVDDLTGKTL